MVNQYLPNDSEGTKQKLLKTIGVKSIENLFDDVPSEARLKRPLSLPLPFSEIEVRRELENILGKNRSIKKFVSFLGGGVWHHYVPTVIDSISSRSEFQTSYTPYQPEINQGMLQALFEYQSMICELVEMEVANCSMYDWASSLGEAARMANRITDRNNFLVPHFIDADKLSTLKSYTESVDIKIIEIKQSMIDGQIDLESLKQKISNKTAGVYVENPAYLGYLMTNLNEIAEIVHNVGGLFIVGVDPISLSVLKPPGSYGADIVIGEGQPLGNYMNYGGSLLGIFACKNDSRFIRQLPGRIVGMTTTYDNMERGFCFTLQTREQHIRREKATSNICTNEALCALRAAVYMSLMGKSGFKILGENILSSSHYAVKILSEIKDLKIPLFEAPYFKEFTINFDKVGKKVKDVNSKLLLKNIIGGQFLDKIFPELGNSALYCVTEMHTKNDIQTLQRSLKEILGE